MPDHKFVIPEPTLNEIFDRGQMLANEIAQMFNDAHYWNSRHPLEQVDPDPQGELRKAYTAILKMLDDPRANRRRRMILQLFSPFVEVPDDHT